MLVYNHILSSGSAALALSGAPAALNLPITTPTRLVFAVAAAGAATLPDIDSPTSTIAHVGGRNTQELARGINRFSFAVYQRTKTARDVHRRDGHRGVTHTLLGALVTGLVTGLVSMAGASAAVALVLVGLFAVARRGTVGRPRHRRWWTRILVSCGVMLLAMLLASLLLPGPIGGFLVGSAVTTGMVAHALLDAPTNSGVPLLWPLTINGQRWFRICLPKRWALTTGGAAELPIGIAWTLIAALQIWALIT